MPFTEPPDKVLDQTHVYDSPVQRDSVNEGVICLYQSFMTLPFQDERSDLRGLLDEFDEFPERFGHVLSHARKVWVVVVVDAGRCKLKMHERGLSDRKSVV